jgi:hypothetical protein
MKENIGMEDENIYTIIDLYNSDIRSMINYIQLNQVIEETKVDIVNSKIWENIHQLFITNTEETHIIEYINNTSVKYNIDKKNIIKQYFNYVIRNYGTQLNHAFFEIVETNIHNNEIPVEYMVKYFVYFTKEYFIKNAVEGISPTPAPAQTTSPS